MNELKATDGSGLTETITLEKFNKDGRLTQRNIVKNGVVTVEHFPEEAQ